MANKRAIAEAIEAGEVKPGHGLAAMAAEPDQAALFGQADDEFAAQFPKVAKRRGPGRPKDARNWTTRKTLELLAAHPHYRDPLLVLASIASMSPADLKSTYGLKGAEALNAQIRAASDLAPYVHSKQPQGVKLEGSAGAPVLIQIGAWATAEPDIRGGQAVDVVARGYDVAEPDISSTYADDAEEVTRTKGHTHDPRASSR